MVERVETTCKGKWRRRIENRVSFLALPKPFLPLYLQISAFYTKHTLYICYTNTQRRGETATYQTPAISAVIRLALNMAVINASLVAFRPHSSPSLLPPTSLCTPQPSALATAAAKTRRAIFTSTFALKTSEISETVDVIEEETDLMSEESSSETLLYSLSPLPLLLLAALPGGNARIFYICFIWGYHQFN